MPESPKAELVKLEIIGQPEIVIVGKYIHIFSNDCQEGKNPIPAFWGKCFEEALFAKLETLADFIHNPAYVGYMDTNNGVWKNGEGRYICGMMMKPGVVVPEGFTAHTLKPAKVAVGWIKGKKSNEATVFANAHGLTEKAVVKKGLKLWGGHDWCMEVYTSPRFTTPDENGDIILDYYIPCE